MQGRRAGSGFGYPHSLLSQRLGGVRAAMVRGAPNRFIETFRLAKIPDGELDVIAKDGGRFLTLDEIGQKTVECFSCLFGLENCKTKRGDHESNLTEACI